MCRGETSRQEWFSIRGLSIVAYVEALTYFAFAESNLGDFIVGATNMNPLVVAPSALSSSDYDVCATEEGNIPLSQLRSYNCFQGVSGRYVFVLKKNSGYLQLCEAQVFASEQKRKYIIA